MRVVEGRDHTFAAEDAGQNYVDLIQQCPHAGAGNEEDLRMRGQVSEPVEQVADAFDKGRFAVGVKQVFLLLVDGFPLLFGRHSSAVAEITLLDDRLARAAFLKVTVAGGEVKVMLAHH